MAYYHSRILDYASAFASHIRSLYEYIRDKKMKNNADYKAYVDLHCKFRSFNVDDYVMVRLRSKRFPLGIMKKLHE